jgi:hypothetical protein
MVVAAMIVLVAAASPVTAQIIRGSVFLPDGATPVAGAIVLAQDESGGTAGRVLTSPRGEFTLRLPAAGRYGLTVMRIGFRPTVIPSRIVAAGAVDTVRVVFVGEPVTLSGMNVRDRESCRIRADSGLAVARVWEEARKAMLSSQLSAEGAPLLAEWIEYDRTLDSDARYVRQQKIRTTKNPTNHAFRSAPVALLDTAGYVVTDATGTTYYLPDAEVLLSPSFAASHCFRLQAPPNGGANLIGVAFSPTGNRKDLREIEGTAWVNRETAELKSLEIRYTNLPEMLEAAHPGGSVEFLRLNDGNWLINRWNVRMPQLGVTTRSSGIGAPSGRSTSAAAIRGTQVTGGEVNRVSRRDSTFYEWHGPRLRVLLRSNDSIMRPAGAKFELDGTDYAQRANIDGQVDMSPVLAGRYKAKIHTALMDSLGMPPVEQDVDVRDGSGVDTLRLPRARDLLTTVCPRDSVKNGEGMLRGRVVDEKGGALRQAAVVVTWQTNFAIVGGVRGDQVNHTEKTIGGLSDNAGGWRLCGVPRNIPVVVSVATDAGSAARGATLTEDFGAVDLQLGSNSASGTEKALASIGAAARRSALVEVAVFNLAGAPVPEVTVDVQPPTGPTRTVVTGATGRALIPEIAPGVLKLRARRVGFKEGQVAVTVEGGRNTVPIILGQNAAPALDTMRVVGGRKTVDRLDGFETRRLNRQATRSYTREDIVKRNPTAMWQMITNVPALKIVDSGMVTAQSTRSVASTPNGQMTASGVKDNWVSACYFAVMVDGQMLTPSGNDKAVDLRLLPPPEEVHGLEVFSGPSSIPPQFGGVGVDKWCGLIAVWTR